MKMITIITSLFQPTEFFPGFYLADASQLNHVRRRRVSGAQYYLIVRCLQHLECLANEILIGNISLLTMPQHHIGSKSSLIQILLKTGL